MGCARPIPAHWEDLRSRQRARVLAHPGSGVGADAAAPESSYEVAFLDARYRLDLLEERIEELTPDPRRILSQAFQILLIRYLTAPLGGDPTGEEISEKELPGGVTFFQGPHSLQVDEVTLAFGHDPAAFEARALALGATRVPGGDCAVRFLPFPLIPVTLVLWQADDEFPASVSVLFDRSIARWFQLDMIYLLVQSIAQRMVEHVR